MSPQPSIQFIVDFGAGNPLRLDLCLPKVEFSPLELLPFVFSVTDAMVTMSSDTLLEMHTPIQCGPGCGACCHQLVPISEYEAVYLAGIVRALPAPQRSRTVARFTDAITTLDASGLLCDLTDTFANTPEDWRTVLNLKKRYWDLAIACPFLEDNSCSIHTHRPVACRQYLVTSKPAHCARIYSSDEAHEVVLHPADIGGALASFSGEGVQKSRVLPHVFSLLAERGIRSRPMATLPAPQMMGRFLDLLTTCFMRRDQGTP